MCNGYFDPKDLENQVNSRSGGNTDDSSADNEDGGGCGCDLGANNGGHESCKSHKGPIEPEPNWGVGGLSIDNPVNEENN